jgi:cyanophycin synthetase
LNKNLYITKSWRKIEGHAFGLHQPVILAHVRFAENFRCNARKLVTGLEAALGSLDEAGAQPQNLTDIAKLLMAFANKLETSFRIPVFEAGEIIGAKKYSKTGYEYAIAAPYVHERPTIACLTLVVNLADRLISAKTDDDIRSTLNQAETSVNKLRKSFQNLAEPGINTARIIRAAIERGTPFYALSPGVFTIGEGSRSRWLKSTFTDQTGTISASFAKRKHLTAGVLARHGLPVAKHFLVANANEAVEKANLLGYPVVVKPGDLDGGIGVHAGLGSEKLVRKFYEEASQHSKQILVEKHFEGRDYRLTVFEGELIKVSERIPGGVTGDGLTTIRELVKRAAQDPEAIRRRKERGKVLLKLDEEAMGLLEELELTPDSIPADGEFVRLRRRANVSTGGTTRLVTDIIHPHNRQLAIRAADVMRLDVAGIDLLIPDIERSWLDSGAVICEVNSQPQIGEGNVPGLYDRFLDKLLGGTGRIPTGLILSSDDETNPGQLREYATGFSAGNSGTILACAELLTLDSTPLARTRRSFGANSVAGILCRQAERILMSGTLEELAQQGLPSQYIDFIVFDPTEALNDSQRAHLSHLKASLLPHLTGFLIYSANNDTARSFADGLPLHKQFMVGTVDSSTIVQTHAARGGAGLWPSHIDDDRLLLEFVLDGQKRLFEVNCEPARDHRSFVKQMLNQALALQYRESQEMTLQTPSTTESRNASV